MVIIEEPAATPAPELDRRLAALPADAVVRVRLLGLAPGASPPLSTARLRHLAPPTMNIELRTT